MEYARIYRTDDESLGQRIAGLCDVLHIDMTTDAVADRSIGDETERILPRIGKMYPNADAEQLARQLSRDIHDTIDNILPLTSQPTHAVYRQEYTYTRICEIDERAFYTFVVCFIY